MTSKVKGSEGIEFPDGSVQGSAAYSKAQSDSGLATKVSRSGDTMTGPLTVTSGSAGLALQRPNNVANYIVGNDSDGAPNWYLGNTADNSTLSLTAARGPVLVSGLSGVTVHVPPGNNITVKDTTVGGDVEGAGIVCVTGNGTACAEWRGVHVAGSYFGGRCRPGSGTNYMEFKSDGNCTTWGQWLPASDGRVKKDREVIGDAVSKVQQLTGYTYRRADILAYDGSPTQVRSGGLIAQDVESVLPEAVIRSGAIADEFKTADDDGEFRHVSYDAVTALLVEAVKELSAKLDTALARIAELEAK